MSKKNTESDDISKYIIDYNQLKFDRVIGMGGYGEVSLGYHIPTGLKVAIKKLFDVNESPRNKELYHREIRTLSLFKNHFLLPFIGFTNTPPYCIVTKYIPNGSLYDALHETQTPSSSPRVSAPTIPPKAKNESKRGSKKAKPKKKTKGKNSNEEDENSENNSPHSLTATEKTFIAYGISVGMQFLHEKGIIHRDLKTQNILLDEHKSPVISDFGSSRYAMDNAPKTSSFGTPNYMAPEFIQGVEYDLPVDVYSYGVILWEMLTEEVPFLGKESHNIIFMVVIQHSRLPIPDETPTNLRKLIEMCWSSSPQERPTFDQITTLFENGKVEFPGTDQNEFNLLLKRYGEKNPVPQKRRHSDVTVHDSCNSDFEMMSNFRLSEVGGSKSVANFLNKRAQAPSIQQKATESLAALDGNDVTKIQQSIEFFESIMCDQSILQIDIWTHLLNFLLKQYNNGIDDDLSIFDITTNKDAIPLELIRRAEKLILNLASMSEILETIKKVNDLFQYLVPNDTFLTLFLYIVNYVPGLIDEQITQRIFKLFLDPRYSLKSATLICRIVQNSPQQNLINYILETLQKNVASFVDMSGGHLIIELLLHYKYLKIDIISIFNRSKIDQNVISSYKSLFSINGQPELFSLQNILQHCLSQNEELRDLALDFIRRFAFGAEREPLMMIVKTHFKAIFTYESEKAALLLVRVSSDPKRCISLINSGYINDFLDSKPSTSLVLLKIFLTIIVADERCKKYFFQHQLIGKYFANVTKNYDEDAIISLCWSLNQTSITPDLATNLTKSGFMSLLCDIITSPRSASFHSKKMPPKTKSHSNQKLIIQSDDENDDDDNDDEGSSSNSSTSSLTPYGLILEPSKLTWYLIAIAKISPFADCDRYPKVVKLLFDLIDNKSIISRNCFITLTSLSCQVSTHITFGTNNIYALFKRYNDNSEETNSYQNYILKNIKDGGKFIIP